MKRLSARIVACSLLAGCSGGGGTSLPANRPISSSPANPSVPVAQQRAAAAFTIVIPKATMASIERQARLRAVTGTKRPQYISAATQSFVVTLTTVNGTPVSSPQPYAANFGGSGCPVTGGVTTCTVTVPATAGNDVFSIATYDTAQSSTTPTTLVGNRLSMQTTTVTIVANTANVVSVPLALDGVVASLGLALGAPGYAWHPAQTIPISIQPRDAAGDLIVAPGGYRDTNGNPLTITLSDSDTSGTTSLPVASFSTTAAAANASLSYNGGPNSAVITATAGSLSHTVALNPSVKSGTIFVGTSNGTQIYDHSGSSSPTLLATIGSGAAHGVVLGVTGSALYQSKEQSGQLLVYLVGGTTPEQTVSGFSSPEELAINPSTARVFVAQLTAGPAYLNPGSVAITGTVAEPSPNGYSQNYGVAVNSAGLMYALDLSSGVVWSYSSNLAVAPSSLISGYNSRGLSFKSNGTLLVSDSTSAVYALNVSNLTRTNVASGLATVYGTAADAAGNVFISLGDSVDEVPISTGVATPIISSSGAGFFQIAVAP